MDAGGIVVVCLIAAAPHVTTMVSRFGEPVARLQVSDQTSRRVPAAIGGPS